MQYAVIVVNVEFKNWKKPCDVVQAAAVIIFNPTNQVQVKYFLHTGKFNDVPHGPQ